MDRLFYYCMLFIQLLIVMEFLDTFFVKGRVSGFLSKIVWCGSAVIAQTATTAVLNMLLLEHSLHKKQISICVWMISCMTVMIILACIKLSDAIKHNFPMRFCSSLFLLPVSGICVTIMLMRPFTYNNGEEKLIFAGFLGISCLIHNIFLVKLYDEFVEMVIIVEFERESKNQMKLCINEMETRLKENADTRNLKHDLKNHLLCIREYVERNEGRRAARYIDNLLCEKNYLGPDNKEYSGNAVIDAVLRQKEYIMKKYEITPIFKINVPIDLTFDDADMCVILGNLLDNAIDAARSEEENKRTITFEMVYQKGVLCLKMKNNYSGKIIRGIDGKITSTKPDGENHGIGLASVKNVVSKYDGEMLIKTEEQIFDVVIYIYLNRKRMKNSCL